MIVPMAESSGTVVLTAPVSSSKDEMTMVACTLTDGIDVVATLVPESQKRTYESSRQQKRAQPRPMQDREHELIAVVDHEDPNTTEAIEAYDARTGERLDSEEVRQGRTKEVRKLDELEVKMEVDESVMRLAPCKNIRLKCVETRNDPNCPAIRCR